MGHKLKNTTVDIKDFVSQFETHPILFVGSGLSRRYLKYSPCWNDLLIDISKDIWGNDDKFLELAQEYKLDPTLIANDFEELFLNEIKDNPKFSKIKIQNDNNIRIGKIISPFKIYLASLFSNIDYKEDFKEEITLFKELKNNIKSIVTTNYDGMLENLFNFDPLVGNNIILSKQYGCIYKMHGCYTDPEKIIFTKSDYDKFQDQNRLIISQLISLFINNPVIFLGYGSEDPNVNNVLETIYNYVGNNQELRDKIKKNFLVVQYSPKSANTKVSDYDKNLPSGVHLSFKQIKTDDYTSIYQALRNASYGVEAGTLRLIDDLANRVFTKTKDKKNAKIINYFVNDINSTAPSNLVLGIIDKNDINQIKESIIYYKDKIVAATPDDFIVNYFEIVDKKITETIKLIDSLQPRISGQNYFPIFAFSEILGSSNLNESNRLKDSLENKLIKHISKLNKKKYKRHISIDNILADSSITESQKDDCTVLNIWNGHISLSHFEIYLRNYKNEKKSTIFRRLIALYDYMNFGNSIKNEEEDIDNEIITPELASVDLHDKTSVD